MVSCESITILELKSCKSIFNKPRFTELRRLVEVSIVRREIYKQLRGNCNSHKNNVQYYNHYYYCFLIMN